MKLLGRQVKPQADTILQNGVGINMNFGAAPLITTQDDAGKGFAQRFFSDNLHQPARSGYAGLQTCHTFEDLYLFNIFQCNGHVIGNRQTIPSKIS